MKKTYNFFKLLVVVLTLTTIKLGAQCTNTSAYSGGVAPAQGSSITAASCQFAGEYCTITSVTSGNTYSVASTVATDYFTVHSGTYNGPVEAAGPAPLVWTATVSGTYYIHCNLNSSCGTASACRNVLLGCYGPACANASSFGSATAPAPNNTITITTCQYGGEYATVSGVTAGNVYVSSSSIGTDYFTIRSGSTTGPVVATGLSPLTWTAQVAGTHYIHVNTNSACGTASSCRSDIIACIGGAIPAAPGNDLCTNATSLAVPSTTAGTTVNATTESPLPQTCGYSVTQPGVWYKIVGNGNQFGADLCAASGWDSKIHVFSGTCGAWNCVTDNDDNGPMCTGAAASVTWCSVPTVTYYILATGYSSANAFTIAITQTVNASTPTVAVTAATPSVCLTSSTALTATGATTYLWDTGATTSSIAVTPTATTVYTVTGRAATGCGYDIKTVTVTALANPTVAISANSASICPSASFVITASGANSYTFNGSPSGTIVATAGSATLSPLVNTTYTVYGTATNGCKSLLASSPTATISTLVSPTLVVTASPSSVCPNATSTITVTGANTYTWISPSSFSNVITVNPSVTTVYTVSGTGTNVCNGFKTVTVTAYPQPTITVNSGTSCAGSVFTMIPGGAATYTFSSGSSTVAPTTSTNYIVSGTSSVGCLSATTAVSSVSVFALPVVTVNSGTMCNNSFFTVLPSGATTYTIIGAGNPVSPSVSTTYSVIGSTTVGCASLPALCSVTVFSLPSLTVVSTPSSNVICDTAPLVLNVSGATTYTWNNTVSGTSLSTTPSVSASYYVIGTDGNGCTNVATIPFTVNPLPQLSLATTNTFLCAGASATLIAAGASNYTWTTPSNATMQVVSPSVSTVYGVTGDNSFGCTKTITLSVNVNTIVMTVSSNTQICLGASANLSALGATNYTWVPSPSPFANITVTPSVTTTYSVTGKDNKNCIHTGAVTVTVNANPTILASVMGSTLICLGESATLTANGATSYAWSITSSTNNTGSPLVVTPANASTINYVVTGTDDKACVGMDTVSLKVDKCTGLTKLANSNSGISVYPNPNNGSFTVEFVNGLTKTIEVTDVSGRLILSTESMNDTINVNLNAYANGIYYVKVQSQATVEVIKVIKQ